MNKCHRISWERHDVGCTVGANLLSLSVTVQCSALPKHKFILPNTETKNVWSSVSHEKLGVTQLSIVLNGS
jgi:hypothetical protein